jgi:hypothetical protein
MRNSEGLPASLRRASAAVTRQAGSRLSRHADENPDSPIERSQLPKIADIRMSWSDRLVSQENRPQNQRGGSGFFTTNAMSNALLDFFLCPQDFVDFDLAGKLSDEAGYFRCGQTAIFYGRSASGYRANRPDAALYDVATDIRAHAGKPVFPFDPTELVDNLRLERYANRDGQGAFDRWERSLKEIYYLFRPFMRVKLRRHIQRTRLIGWRNRSFPRWPVDTTVEDICERWLLSSMMAKGVDKVPFIWFWPDGAQSCVAMTHDVETEKGRDFCFELMNVDDSFGIKASFQIVPEGRYEVPDTFVPAIRDRGFEINVQDLNHDGNLFRNRSEFCGRAQQINKYAACHGISGFRAAVLYRNLDWYDALDFSFDMSVPNVAHLDPQKGGCCTVMPYFFGQTLEIPVTTTQDYMLFYLLNDYSLDVWKEQIRAIVARNGLVSFIIHPDYVIEEKAMKVYRDLLAFLRESRREHQLWFALPGAIDRWWRARRNMRLVREEDTWRIVGEGAERAKLAFAQVVGDRLKFEVES